MARRVEVEARILTHPWQARLGVVGAVERSLALLPLQDRVPVATKQRSEGEVVAGAEMRVLLPLHPLGGGGGGGNRAGAATSTMAMRVH